MQRRPRSPTTPKWPPWSFPFPPKRSGSSGALRTDGPSFRPLLWISLAALSNRKDYGHGRALAGLALYTDAAAMLLNNSIADGQSQASALSHIPRTKERVEDLIQVLLRNAAAV